MVHDTSSARPVVLPADPGWQARGRVIAGGLSGALGPAALRIEHIGSTAIPGMAAKPVFDLQVSVGDLAAAAALFEGPLAELGFRRSPYERDHVPAGSGDDPARWGKRMWWLRPEDGAGEAVNLHARVAGSPNERLALLFRDWFRAHPGAVPAYAAFKRTLAGAVPDVGTYADVKDPVVDLVVTVAEPWAAETGWRP
ncbi:GrpB family protein [Streptomyces sp. NBC_00388]|uniref:GrpB family protein n=1 Tax=Streptomyces sp. NBC_00388 TaxID=2975735 RepID=UPI002E24E64E